MCANAAPPVRPPNRWRLRALLWLGEIHRRLLGVLLAVLGPRAAYALVAWPARALYRLLPPLRDVSVARLQAAFPVLRPAQIEALAADAFVHRAWNLVDLLLAPRLLHPGTYARYGGTIPAPHLDELLAAQRRGQPAILVTAYYGSFDLLPTLLGYNGVQAAAVYLPHANPHFDAFRRRVRARSGCELVPLNQALARLPAVLERGGTIAVLADQPATRGVPLTFLGCATHVSRAIGVLAARSGADVVVAGLARRGPFQFEVVVQDVMKAAAWAEMADPVPYITARYVEALEALIRQDPRQYLWLQPRGR
jgi:Kdo2-lipid IVA lauroyltransferase/acyltransferase